MGRAVVGKMKPWAAEEPLLAALLAEEAFRRVRLSRCG